MTTTIHTTTTMHAIPDCADFDLDAITLSHGSHGPDFRGQCCAIEAANRAATCVPALREKYGAPSQFTDDHPSISRVIRSFTISWNDALRTDEERTRLLRPFVVKVLGTATTSEDEETRAWMATDWLCRVQTPAWLRLAGLVKEAEALEATARIADAVTARAAQPALDEARSCAAAAWAAAGDVAWAAAWDAARAAAWAAAWAAAGDAAWAAAGDAARAAAWDAAWAAAGDAAWDAAWAAARAAAGAALQPTVETLQQSAVDLLDAMCAVGRTA